MEVKCIANGDFRKENTVFVALFEVLHLLWLRSPDERHWLLF